METNNKDSNLTVVAVVLLAILVVGYFVWPKDKLAENGADGYNSNTQSAAAVDTPSVSPVASASPTPTPSVTPTTNSPKNLMHTITIETNKGTIVFETYDADAPKAVQNFITLANKSFYNGVIFHRVIKGFMIQGGDPTGTGRGGPGYQFEDELDPNTPSAKAGYQRGVVAMANAGPNTNGSQFFIMHQDYPLPHSYTIFGKVVKGLDVVDAIANVKTDANDKPLENITMKSVKVAENK